MAVLSQGEEALRIERVPLEEVAEALAQTRPFAQLGSAGAVAALGKAIRVDLIHAAAGAVLLRPGDRHDMYCVVLEGELRVERPEKDGSFSPMSVARAGEGFGETPLLIGKTEATFLVVASRDSVLIRFTDQDFWNLLACCPTVRTVVLADMAQRLQSYQAEALHREKLISLGTLAAGLMHELHNPGSAAKRASGQLRLNLLRLQGLSLRFADEPKTPLQLECMRLLLEHTMNGCRLSAMGTIEQSEAEERMAEWLAASGVENAFSIAPALVGIGLKQEELVCAKDAFTAGHFSDALNWLEALVSSVTLVCTIEESITRVSELVMAVKKFAYDEKAPAKQLDVHDSLQSTLTILGHKLRLKGIQVEKQFTASPSIIHTRGSSLSQVWTNLIDNALDASPANGRIRVETWIERGKPGAEGLEGEDTLAVCVEDHGSGIPPEAMPRIFEAFFTTKAEGSGTGLGLEIVHRIVTQKFGGTIEVKSEPGNTRFIVRLPFEEADGAVS
jgi:signal transduction histidine kinase